MTAPHYESNYDHLADELQKLDLMIQLRVLEFRCQTASTRGVAADPQVAISHAEVDRLLAPDFASTADIPELIDIRHQLVALQSDINAKVKTSIDHGVFLALPQLAHLFALSPLELQTLLICLAPELRRKYDRLYAYLQDDITRKKPSIDLVLNLLYDSEVERWAPRSCLSAQSALFRAGILSTTDDPQSPSGSSGLAQFLTLDRRILHYVLGDNSIDGRLHGFVELVSPPSTLDHVLIDASITHRLMNLTRSHFSDHNGSRKKLVLYFHGPYGVGKRELAAGMCSPLGSPLLCMDVERLMANPAQSDTLLRLAFREGLLLQAALYFDNVEGFFGENDKAHPIVKQIAGLVSEYGWLTCLGGDKPRPLRGIFEDAVFQAVELPMPDVPLREAAWKQSLQGVMPDHRSEWNRQLASQFRLTPGQIRHAAAFARNKLAMHGSRAMTLADLYEACRSQSHHKLGELAVKRDPHYSWDDIVLPEDKIAQLREICGQVKHRYKVFDEWGFDRKLSYGKGLSVLFTGPPGTGKTMAAEVLAHELQLDLYKVDLSGVVSKYIGETEKNLSRIFNEAETSNAILFFDEADALFGKRTEVSDAHDRYANIETSYLLQKMEAYEGVVILATNLRENMDEAFTRRIRFVVDFPFPDAASRLDIWKKHFPDEAPTEDDLDYAFLAKAFALAGGNIKNIALNAAFFAAADGQAICMDHVMRGAKREFEKIGKTWSESKSFLTGREQVERPQRDAYV